jgi:ribonuclease BN (tRNA processing enzyme)
MRITVLGGSGAFPTADQACSGYLVEHDGFHLLVDPGYATVPRLLAHIAADDVDAVLISHGHPDHCADLNPLLRARALSLPPTRRRTPPGDDDLPPPLPVYALPGATDAVLALDRPGMLDHAYVRHELRPGDRLSIGPFSGETRLLPHFTPNAGIRLAAGGAVLAYTGDTGPTPDVAELARGADILLAEASYAEEVPADSARYLSSARQAGRYAADAGVGRLVLTHLMPGTDPDAARDAAAASFDGSIEIAAPGLLVGTERVGRVTS